MIRLWLSRNSAASLRDQLATQIMLAVSSGDLAAGDKLPSVRELARRYSVHANTVSAAYRDLADRGWLDLRKGSGVYVRALAFNKRDSLGALMEGFLTSAREQGFSEQEIRDWLNARIERQPARRIAVMEPEPELREILAAALREHLRIPVMDRFSEGCAVTALATRAAHFPGLLPSGVRVQLLRMCSVREYFDGQQRPQANALIGVASASPEVLRRTRTLLAAAGLDAEALELRDARETGWKRGLNLCEFVIADVVTARKLPPACKVRVFRVLSEASIRELKQFLGL